MTLLIDPPAVDRETFQRAAKEFVWGLTGNSLRNLPRGVKGSYTDCPLARATGWSIGVFSAHKDELTIPLPPLVVEFRRLFDKGLFPELVDPDDADRAFEWSA